MVVLSKERGRGPRAVKKGLVLAEVKPVDVGGGKETWLRKKAFSDLT